MLQEKERTSTGILKSNHESMDIPESNLENENFEKSHPDDFSILL